MLSQNNDSNTLLEIDFICKMMFDVLKIPVYFLSKKGNLVISYCSNHIINPLSSEKSTLFSQLFSENNIYDFPIIKSTKYKENYFAINLKKNSSFFGTFVVGPSLYSKINYESINKIISENNIPISHKNDLINFYNRVTVLDYHHLINASLLLYYCIYNKKLDASTVTEKNSSLTNFKIKNSHIVSESYQNLSFHHTLTHERNIFESVKEGNKEKLLHYLEMPFEGEYGILSKDYLRSKKNLVICSVTLATRAAIAGGMSSEAAYSLSDSYIQDVEQTNEINDLLNLQNNMLLDFTDIVNKIKESKYPNSIVFCENYISDHIYDAISLSTLAALTRLSEKYLSSLFSKSIGITFTEYVQKKKIDEAKFLLTSTNYSILDICTLLNFHDQSHFTKVFKKFTETTPKKYKSFLK